MLGVLLLILFAILDLGLLAMRETSIQEGSRRLARLAIVRGKRSAGTFTAWGPASMSGTAASAPFHGELSSVLVAMPPSEVQVFVEWPHSSNEEDNRVVVTLRYTHRPIIPAMLGRSEVVLQSTSTMRIAH